MGLRSFDISDWDRNPTIEKCKTDTATVLPDRWLTFSGEGVSISQKFPQNTGNQSGKNGHLDF
jgi:hypothetical protein